MAFCACLTASVFKEGNQAYLSGDYNSALSAYSEFLEKNPGRYEGWYNSGNALFRQGKYEEALSMYEKALSLNPKDEDTKYNIEETKRMLEKNQEKNPQDKKDKQQSSGNGKEQEKQGKTEENGRNNKGNGQQKNADSKQDKGQGGEKTEAQKQMEDKAAEQARKEKLGAITEDEAQAILNSMKRDEKQYRGYFGNNNNQRKSNDPFDQMFEMMQKRMFGEQAVPQQGQNGNEKNW